MNTARFKRAKEALLVGKIKNMIESGYSPEEITKTLGISIVTFNAYKKMIDDVATKKQN